MGPCTFDRVVGPQRDDINGGFSGSIRVHAMKRFVAENSIPPLIWPTGSLPPAIVGSSMKHKACQAAGHPLGRQYNTPSLMQAVA